VEDIVRLLVRFGADVGAREGGGSQNTVFHLLNDQVVSSRILLLLTSCSPTMPFSALNSSHLTAFQVSFKSIFALHFPLLHPFLLSSHFPHQMARGSTKMVFVWSQLWMYHNLPSWIPILSTTLTCLLFLILIDSLGWIYGFLLWILLTILVFDKVAQGILERGVFRMHQGLVLGYFLSILWINLRYLGGVDSLLDSNPSTHQSFFFSIGRNISSENAENLSSSRASLVTCALSVCSLLLAYLASVKKAKTQSSTEDRSQPLSLSLSLSPSLSQPEE
jgi:hypothetical protein